MRRREVTLALGLAAMSGVLAAVFVSDWMSTQSERLKEHAEQPSVPVVQLAKIVVAKENIPFGKVLTKDNVVEAEWLPESVPNGAFKSVDEFFKEQGTRSALSAISAKEPILRDRVTGPGERTGLSTLLEPGKKAVTIRTNDVIGVGGLVKPGDTVDIFMTDEAVATDKSRGAAQPYTVLLLERMRVLAVDSILDPAHAEPIQSRTVTVAATLSESQSITLAATVGTLSLVLAGPSLTDERLPRLTAADLPGDSGDKSSVGSMIPTMAIADEPKSDASDVEVSVPIQRAERPAAVGKAVTKVGPKVDLDKVKVSVVRAIEAVEYDVVRRGPPQ
jgi:pilus assembly protein CpaB